MPAIGCSTSGAGATCASCATRFGAGNYVVCPAMGSMAGPICVQGNTCPG
jgi:hypothetical protein